MTGPPVDITRTDDGTPAMTWRREYPDPATEVWAAVTEPDRLGRWIGTWSGEPRVGGTVAFVMTGEVDAGGETGDPVDVRILACDPPRRLVVEMPAGDETWHIEIVVADRADGAVLWFTQTLPDGERRPDVEAGWSWYLDRLTASLRGATMPAWSDYAP